MSKRFYDFWEEWRSVIIPMSILLSVIVCCISTMVTTATVAEVIECHQATKDIGLNSRWFLIGGCQIEIEPDRWIPLRSYRWIEE